MIKCALCKTLYVPNTIFCTECGHFLLEDDKRVTDQMDPSHLVWLEQASHSSTRRAATNPLMAPITLRLKIGSNRREIQVQLNRPIHIGRVDPGGDVFPDIDLSDHDPQAKMVSRRHARLFDQKNRVMIEDLGSINGTYLNGKRLPAFFPEVLSNGDRLQLGSLQMEVVVA